MKSNLQERLEVKKGGRGDKVVWMKIEGDTKEFIQTLQGSLDF